MALIVSALLVAILCSGSVIAVLEVRKRRLRALERHQDEVRRARRAQLTEDQPQPRIGGRTQAPARPRPAAQPRPEVAPARDAADMYVQWCASRLEETANANELEHQELVDQGARTAIELRESAAKQRDLEIAQSVFGRLREERKTLLEQAFNAVVAREVVARVEVTDYGWMFVTTPLFMKSAADRFELGKMEIHLDHFGRARIFNQTLRPIVRGTLYDHPLVRDGEPLFPAALRCQLAISASRQRIDEAFNLLVAFLTQIPDMTFISAHAWRKEIRHEKILVPEL